MAARARRRNRCYPRHLSKIHSDIWAGGLLLACLIATIAGCGPNSPDHAGQPSDIQAQRKAESLFAEAKESVNAGKMWLAVDKLRAAATLSPKDATIFATLGDALSNLKQMNDALQAFQQAASIQPSSVEYSFHVARLHAQLAATDEAYHSSANMLQVLLRTAPTVMPIRLTLAGLHMRFSHFLAARDELEQAARIDPNRSTIWYNLSTACTKLGDEPCAERATHKYAGLMALQQRAVKLQKLVLRHPENPKLHYDLSLLLRSVGDYQTAYREIGRAAELAPDDKEIQRTYATATDFIRRLQATGSPPSMGGAP